MEKLVDYMILEMMLKQNETVSSSEYSDDEAEVDIMMKRKRIRIKNFIEDTVRKYSDKEFISHFRLTRNLTYNLISEFERHQLCPTHTFGKRKITAEASFLMGLWYLANTETFRQISDRFDVPLISAHRCLVRVINFIVTLRDQYIKWPDNFQKIESSEAFFQKHGFRGVIGAIDGSHIKITRPEEQEEVYVNREGFHSLLLQVVADHRKMFIDVYCGEPGSMHDARMLKKSNIYSKAQNPHFFENWYLLGDSAYPALQWIVPPFRDTGNLTENQKNFNFRLSSTRMIVEHSLGLLKGRFRRLHCFENLNIPLITKCVMAACVLHNICMLNNLSDDEVSQNNDDEDTQNNVNGVENNLGNLAVLPDFHNQGRGVRRQQIFTEMFG